MTFRDYFSGHAKEYAQYRPGYPHDLFDFLARISPQHQLAWDCATGNGQAASVLAHHFQHVIGTDASNAQIEHATGRPNITYRVARENDSGLASASVDLITVAQAFHWLDLDAFYPECKRVLRPSGVVAVWCYQLLSVEQGIDHIIEEFYSQTLRSHWAPERQLVDQGYAGLPFPFEELTHPTFAMTIDLTLPALLQYIGTWSAVKHFQTATGTDPIPDLATSLEPLWGDPGKPRQTRWPIGMRVGRHNP